MVMISFFGVHGSGKTLTAKFLLSQLENSKYVPLEAIGEVKGLDPIQRQTLYFTTYVRQYLKNSHTEHPVIFDSHPALTIPYTDYWIKDSYRKRKIMEAFQIVVENLPKTDYLVYLRTFDVELVRERIFSRTDTFRDKSEEANPEYIKAIMIKVEEYLKLHGSKIAHSIIVIPAEIEVDERAKKILEIIK